LVEVSPHITNAEIEAETSLHPTIIKEILHESLNMKKIDSRSESHQISLAQKEKRVECCRENRRLIAEGKLRASDIFTGDES
jgi:hypothetical protein